MKTLKGRVLVHGNTFVNEDMLYQGIYATDKPYIHWNPDITIEKYIEDTKFVSETVGHEWSDEMYENIKKCKFIDVTLEVNES